MEQSFGRSRFFTVAASMLIAGSLVSCSPRVGDSIVLDTVPRTEQETYSRLGAGKSLAVGMFNDARTPVVTGEGTSAYTEASGDVARLAEQSLTHALKSQGYQVSPTSPYRLAGQITKWRTKVTTKATAQIQSEAAIQVQVLDNRNNVVYNGSYVGTRSSEGPVVSKNDIRNSLSVALATATAQVAEDQKLIQALNTTPTNGTNTHAY
ncbi:MAG: hypothetical protein IT290_13225 [Deltaproteobacteria bacterium]|nr:hypothetical protein [Deltaproteobacteria bacterium]